MKSACAIALIFLVATIAGAQAWSPRIGQQIAHQEATIAPEISALHFNCGANIAVTFDWKSIPAKQIRLAANFCTHALDATSMVCESILGSHAVKKQITGITCGYAKQRSMSLNDGRFEFKSDFIAPDDRSTIIEYLQNKL